MLGAIPIFGGAGLPSFVAYQIIWLILGLLSTTIVFRIRAYLKRDHSTTNIAFFHPYCFSYTIGGNLPVPRLARSLMTLQVDSRSFRALMIPPVFVFFYQTILFEALVICIASILTGSQMFRLCLPRMLIYLFLGHSNDGGGGERVLWRAIDALLAANGNKQNLRCIIYSGDNATPQQILEKAKNRFSIDLLSYLALDQIQFVFLSNRVWIEASSWPRFTMIGQSLGSVMLAVEALWKYCPHIYCDSMGYAFTFPVFRYFGGCTIACYVHYPTISTDMLSKVRSNQASFNNSSDVASSVLKTQIKAYYYNFFAQLYSVVGNRADLIMVNSSWTRNHITNIWRLPNTKVHLIFPACDTSNLQQLKLEGRDPLIISLGQFRPEKNHPLQLDAFLELRNKYPELNRVKLAIVGGTRVGNEGDQRIVANLTRRIEQEPLLQGAVSVHVNVPNDELKTMLARATVGLHTMSHEHFGIGVVEFMAAGVIPVAHNSGGPKADIVVPYDDQPTGFLATTAIEYADCIHHIFSNPGKATQMQIAGRRSAKRFSDEEFSTQIVTCFKSLPQLRNLLTNN